MSLQKQSKNILNIDALTVTPSMLDVYGYELKGGKHYQANSRDVKKLTKLLEDSDITERNEITELSTELFMGSENDNEENESSSSSISSSSTDVSSSSSSKSGLEALSDLTEDEPKHPKEVSSEHSEVTSEKHSESELKGGANKSSKSKKKHHRKHFFDDSDLDLNSTTSSILSSLSSSDC